MVNEKLRNSILVIDDEPDFLSIIRHILTAKGFEVETAATAAEAIAMSGKRFYHITVLDISLPDMDGTELLTMLLRIQPDTIAIMLTGHSSVQNAMKSLNRGAFGYLEKPLDPEYLLSTIDQGLEKQRLTMENRQLLQELEQRNHDSNILLAVAQSISQSLNEKEIITRSLKIIVETENADSAWVHLVTSGAYNFSSSFGLSENIIGELEACNPENDIVGSVFNNNRPLEYQPINNIFPISPMLNSLTRNNYHSYAGIPLTIAGNNLGVLSVANYRGYYFGKREMAQLCAIAREVSIGIQNARLYEEASSAKALRELDCLRTQILANVSHELRTPLTVIKGYASSLIQPDVQFDESIWREFLVAIDQDADNLTELVEDLLTMSRLESGALELKKEPLTFEEVIKSARGRLEHLAHKHILNIITSRDLPPISIDSRRINEVLTNLVENSVKYSPEGASITLNACQNGDKVLVSITDEGIGIPAELHQKVFSRFFRVKTPASQSRNGTGLGLAICKGIIEAHGGRIWLESEPGKGTTFRFTLPTIESGGNNHG